MDDCDCSIPAGQLAPEPSAAPMKVILSGQRYEKNGQTVRKPVAVATDGSMLQDEPTSGGGDYVFVAGDGLVFYEGIFVIALRSGIPVPAPPIRR